MPSGLLARDQLGHIKEIGHKSLSAERSNAHIPADPRHGVQRCDVTRSCLAGRLLSAMPLIALFDP